MHDITDLERRGIPGVFVASAPFEDAADVQSKALGFAPAYVLVAHPIQDRTDAEMTELAQHAFDAITEALLGS